VAADDVQCLVLLSMIKVGYELWRNVDPNVGSHHICHRISSIAFSFDNNSARDLNFLNQTFIILAYVT
jgi:hypothetical protein